MKHDCKVAVTVLLTTVAVGFLIPATARGQVDPTSACESGKLPDAHREFTYGGLRLVVPDSLVVTVNGYGTLVMSSDSSRWLALLEIVSSPLTSVNGYPNIWEDLDGYLRYTNASADVVVEHGLRWRRRRANSHTTWLAIKGDRFYQVSRHGWSRLVQEFADVVDEVIASICWIDAPDRERD